MTNNEAPEQVRAAFDRTGLSNEVPTNDCDTPHWFGLKFPGLDVPHQLPFLTEDDLGQLVPKITIELRSGQYGIGQASRP
jgi:hypothetical protein